MPISVSCPSCSAEFKVKDEYAGKRAKCPKCGEPITIPAVVDTVLMPPPAKAAAPVAARPVVASKPTPAPVDDEADEPPVSPKRKRGVGDEDDEQPRAKKRARDDDEDDKPAPKRKRGDDDDAEEPVRPKRKRGADSDEDEPKGKRRRRDDDDDAPKKKSKALPIILGIGGGLLLLCGGGCAGVYFLVLKPLNDDLAARGSARMSMFDPPKTDPGVPISLPPDEPLILKANDLCAEFEKDVKAATEKYNGKTITVRGAPKTTGPTGAQFTFQPFTGSKKVQVQANFPHDAREESKKQRAGDAFTFTAKFFTFQAVGTDGGTIVLIECKVVK